MHTTLRGAAIIPLNSTWKESSWEHRPPPSFILSRLSPKGLVEGEEGSP